MQLARTLPHLTCVTAPPVPDSLVIHARTLRYGRHHLERLQRFVSGYDEPFWNAPAEPLHRTRSEGAS